MFNFIGKFLSNIFGRERKVESVATDNDNKKYPASIQPDTVAEAHEVKEPIKTKHAVKIEEKRENQRKNKVKKIYVCRVGYKDKLVPEKDLAIWIKKGWQKGRRPKEV